MAMRHRTGGSGWRCCPPKQTAAHFAAARPGRSPSMLFFCSLPSLLSCFPVQRVFDMNLDDLNKRITRLEDIEAIKQLKARYCEICDDNHNPDRITSVFTE